MHATISALPGGTIDLWDDSASAVFIVKVDYESAGEIGTQQSKLVIDTMDFLESCRNDVGQLHGREISVEPIEEDDMHGSVYFLATHTPIHVKRIKISQGDSPNHVNVVMSYRLLYDQSGLAEDEDAQINASLELE